jgi:hypothetical protein
LRQKALKSASRVGSMKRGRHPRRVFSVGKHVKRKNPAPKGVEIHAEYVNYESCTTKSVEFHPGCLVC